jgi:ankyrin repeat protein
MRVFVFAGVVAASLTSLCLAEPTESDRSAIHEPGKLSDLDLALAYLGSWPKEPKLTFEIQRRGSAPIVTAIYDAYVSSACPSDSLVSGFARIVQAGAELTILRYEPGDQDSRHLVALSGVVVKSAIAVVVSPRQERLVGTVYEDRIDLVARSGSCSMSFARAVNLHDAVRADDIELVRSVLKSGANVNESDSWGTPLGIAVSKGSDTIVELLIEAGADVEGPTVPAVGGQRPLHLAATRLTGASTARLLISRGARLDARDKAGRTPLITAIVSDNIRVAEVLLAAGADMEGADSQLGATPLSWAACSGRFTTVSFLLSKGAQINAKAGPEGDTPLHHAVRCCHKMPEMISFLVANGANVNAKNDRGLTPIQQAFNRAEKKLLRGLGAID